MIFLKRIKEYFWNIRKRIYIKQKNFIYFLNNEELHTVVQNAKIPIIVREILESDSEQYCLSRETNTKEDLMDRLSKGYIGMGAFYEDKIISYFWQATKTHTIEELNLTIYLPPKYRYGFDGYTHPDYRRMGVYNELRTRSHPIFIEKGYPCAIAIIDVENYPSLNAQFKVGGRILGIVSETIIFGVSSLNIICKNLEDQAFIKKIFEREL